MNTLLTAAGILTVLAVAALLIRHLRPSNGRHSDTLGPAHTGATDGPSPEIEYGRPLDTPSARAALVDYAANLRRAGIEHILRHDLDAGTELNQWAANLEALLKRWDIHHIDA